MIEALSGRADRRRNFSQNTATASPVHDVGDRHFAGTDSPGLTRRVPF